MSQAGTLHKVATCDQNNFLCVFNVGLYANERNNHFLENGT